MSVSSYYLNKVNGTSLFCRINLRCFIYCCGPSITFLIYLGQYRLKDGYSFLEVDEKQWMHEMSPDQRNKHLRKVLNA
jgi:hypothetical protein